MNALLPVLSRVCVMKRGRSDETNLIAYINNNGEDWSKSICTRAQE